MLHLGYYRYFSSNKAVVKPLNLRFGNSLYYLLLFGVPYIYIFRQNNNYIGLCIIYKLIIIPFLSEKYISFNIINFQHKQNHICRYTFSSINWTCVCETWMARR